MTQGRQCMKRSFAILTLLTGLGALPMGVHAQDKTLVVTTAGGQAEAIQRKYFFDPFEKETGIKVVTVGTAVADRNAKFVAMNKTGNVEWDMMFVDEITSLQLREYLASPGPNCERVPNAKVLGVDRACREMGVVSTLSCICLTYPTGPGETPMKTWADFFDLKKFPGPRGLPSISAPWDVMAIALIADGVAPDKLYPLDVDRALKKLDTIKSDVAVWWKNGAQTEQMMRSGEVKYAAMWDTRAGPLRAGGMPIDQTWYRAVMQTQIWVVANKASHQEAAWKFINFYLTRPEAHAGFTRELQLATGNKAALDMMSPELKAKSFANPENAASVIEVDADWILKNRDVLVSRWNTWLGQ